MPRPPTPPPIIIPNCAACILKWSAAGRTFSNVLHIQNTQAGPINPALPSQLFGFVSNAFSGSGFAAYMRAADSGLIGLEVRDLRFGTGAGILFTPATPTLGTGVGNVMSQNVAIGVTLRTASGGRQFRGRVFLGGLIDGAGDTSGRIIGGAQTASQAFLDTVRQSFQTATFPLVIAQRELLQGTDSKNRILPARPAGIVLVTAVATRDTRFDTQRRRLGRT